MSVEKDIQSLEREVKHLEMLARQETRRSRSSSRWTLVVSTSLGLILLLFVAINYFKLSSEWTRDRFTRSLEGEMRELSPLAMRELNTLGQEIGPVYVEEIKKQLARMMPEISRRMETELDELSGEILTGVQKRLDEAQTRVLQRTETVVFDVYPSLRSPAEQEAMEARFHEITVNAVAKVIGNFSSRFGAEVEKVQQTLLTFDVSDSDETTFDLQKEFIHQWLQLLDQEIMEL
ncbi:MAG: hypothetical protein JXA90_03435 [Planctomycetes bacterium]|nr:hypothetical protein [Planctomycetota bacterium]